MAKFDESRPFAPPVHIQFKRAKKDRPEFIHEATLNPHRQIEAPLLVVRFLREGAERDLVGHLAALGACGFIEQPAHLRHELRHDLRP